MGGGEDEAELVGDVVAGEGGAGGAFSEDYAVVDGGDGCGGSADVDDQSGGFAGGKAGEKEVIQLGTGEEGGRDRSSRGENAASREPESWSAPILHGDFNWLFPAFTRVPAGFCHEQRVLLQRPFLHLNAFHLLLEVVRLLIKAIGHWVAGFSICEP